MIKQDFKYDGQLNKKATNFWKAKENIGQVWKDRKMKWKRLDRICLYSFYDQNWTFMEGGCVLISQTDNVAYSVRPLY